MKFFLPLFLLAFSIISYGQQQDTTFSSATAAVRIFQPEGLNQLTGHPSDARVHNGKARGYRIQIYNGIDRQKAKDIQLDFMRSHPGVQAYLTYSQPHFRVRVGDFPERNDAMDLYSSLQGNYTCIIVPEIINVKQ